MTPPVTQRRTLLLLLLLLVFVALLFVRVREFRQSWTPHVDPPLAPTDPPELLVGTLAAAPGPVIIDLHPPSDLDGMTRWQVYEVRRQAVAEHPDLARNYSPSGAVYGSISSGAPWWGTVGQFLHGPGPDSTEGPSEEARYVVNPYLLVGVDIFEASRWGGFRWDHDALAELPSAGAELILTIPPTALTWWPAESRAEVVYDATTLVDSVSPFAIPPPALPLDGTHIDPQNARDLGLNFLYLYLEASEHVTQAHRTPEPVLIRSFLHRGGSCRYPGGCNNGSPYQRQLDDLRIEQLPARLVVKLWQEAPESAGDAADFEFVVRFE